MRLWTIRKTLHECLECSYPIWVVVVPMHLCNALDKSRLEIRHGYHKTRGCTTVCGLGRHDFGFGGLSIYTIAHFKNADATFHIARHYVCKSGRPSNFLQYARTSDRQTISGQRAMHLLRLVDDVIVEKSPPVLSRHAPEMH